MSSGLHTGLRLLGNITLLGEFYTLDVRASVLYIAGNSCGNTYVRLWWS